MHSYRKAVVLGCGASGAAAARLLRADGAGVVVLDDGTAAGAAAQAEALRREGLEVITGRHEWPRGDFDVCVTSPGIPPSSPWIRAARESGLPVLSELELGWSRRRCPVVAVTGSNGKSTLVKWLAESLQAAGLRAVPAGNYGPPVSRVVLEQPAVDWLVLEVSTFQLETVCEFRPEVGVLLNIHPNHLDRHGDMETYEALKARLFARTRTGDTCIVHEPLINQVRSASGGGGLWVTFGVSASSDYRYADGVVTSGGREVLDLRGTLFANDVLGLAGAAAAAALSTCGVDPRIASRSAGTFKPLPHRMQPVGEIRGVRFVNDSKATNLAAMAAALRMIPSKIRLIAGGLVKEKDFTFVKDLLAQKVRGVYLIGQASKKMASAWSDIVPCVFCETLDVAVGRARDDAQAGEVVLLSPACASFDQFKNFEARGDEFARLVRDRVEGVLKPGKDIEPAAGAAGDTLKGASAR